MGEVFQRVTVTFQRAGEPTETIDELAPTARIARYAAGLLDGRRDVDSVIVRSHHSGEILATSRRGDHVVGTSRCVASHAPRR